MRYLHHQTRWQELKRSHRVVILWAATARKIPNAVQGSVGRVETTPIAIIPDIGRRFPPPWTAEELDAPRFDQNQSLVFSRRGSLRDRGKNSCEADNWYRCPCGGNVVRNFIQPSGWRCPLVRSSKHRDRHRVLGLPLPHIRSVLPFG